MMDDTMKSLLKRAAESPEDYTLLGVAADRACECGYMSLERTLRWMVANRKWPVGETWDSGTDFCWQHEITRSVTFSCRSLPGRLCSRMGIAATGVPAHYSRFFVAVAVLALALELEPQEN